MKNFVPIRILLGLPFASRGSRVASSPKNIKAAFYQALRPFFNHPVYIGGAEVQAKHSLCKSIH